MKYEDITRRIIGCAMEVHNTLGCGFQEIIYQRALVLEFKTNNIVFEREKNMPILYKGMNIGTRRVDFYVDNCIMLEIKAVSQMEEYCKAQAINYLEAYDVEVRLLINFGAKSLEFHRLYNKTKVV